MADFKDTASKILQESWEAFFGASLDAGEQNPVVGKHQTWLTACVDIIGEQILVVIVSIPLAPARVMVAKTLGMGEDETPQEMVQDLMGEVANQVAGQIKSEIDRAGLGISLPTVILGDDYKVRISKSKTLFRRIFQSGNQPVVLELRKAHKET